jgi:hypothetical protein
MPDFSGLIQPLRRRPDSGSTKRRRKSLNDPLRQTACLPAPTAWRQPL